MICTRCGRGSLRIVKDQRDVAYCSNCSAIISKEEYIENKFKIKPLPKKTLHPTLSYDQWMESARTNGESQCGCGNPNSFPPCYWCTEGSLNQYEAWCEENGQQPEYDNPVNRTNSQGNKGMQLNRKNFAEFFRTDFYTVSVKFFGAAGDLQPKEYTYKVHKDMKVNIGDRVFVCTSNEPKMATELKATVVTNINLEPELEGSDCINYKWIVGKLEDVLLPYFENIERDNRLKKAVSTLERKLEQIHLRRSIVEAMGELSAGEQDELKALFGADLLGPQQLTGDTEAK